MLYVRYEGKNRGSRDVAEWVEGKVVTIAEIPSPSLDSEAMHNLSKINQPERVFIVVLIVEVMNPVSRQWPDCIPGSHSSELNYHVM